MRLEAVELHLVPLRMRLAVGTAGGVHRERPVLYVRVLTDETEGWGECSALAHGTAVDAPVDAVWRFMTERGVARLGAAARARGGELPPAGQVPGLFDTAPVPREAAAALEMAVLDAELRVAGEPLWSRLGVAPSVATAGVPVGEVVGIPADRNIRTVVAAVAAAVERGAARVRLKIEPGWDDAPVLAVRGAFPTFPLQVDANGSYGSETVPRLDAIDGAGLTCIEQPLPPADLPGLARLAARLATPVCLDESLSSLRKLVDALRYQACELACIKPARFGGLLGARRAELVCLEAGIPAFVGGFFETGFGRSALAALSGLPGFTLPGDLSQPSVYLEEDPGSYDGDGSAARPFRGPGVAPAPHFREPGTSWRWDARGRPDGPGPA